MIRVLISTLLILASAFWFFVGALFSFTSDIGNEAVEKNYQILSAFEQSSKYLDEFYKENKSFPEKARYSDWVSQYSNRVISPRRVGVLYGEFPQEVKRQFQPAPANSYVLTYRRSDWTEYYVSWRKESTLTFDESEYYIGKNRYWQFALVHAIPSILVFSLALFIGRKFYRKLGKG